MAVTERDVDHIAGLARLTFTMAEKQALVHDLNTILKYMEQLNTLDTSGVEPLAQVNDLDAVFRDDVLQPGLSRAEALRNAPSRSDTLFRVPKVPGQR